MLIVICCLLRWETLKFLIRTCFNCFHVFAYFSSYVLIVQAFASILVGHQTLHKSYTILKVTLLHPNAITYITNLIYSERISNKHTNLFGGISIACDMYYPL